ncbi:MULTISPECIES: ABC transporter ATP-binding protein [Streptomyces]|uniref:ABC transporter ATP-binding protein n=1 Tax=Streptomyces TaxID=1883 RepID=UPI0004C9E68D|nr:MULTISPECIES: ABC transporter ATP-binding protein [unclassified Streptomyces]
MTQAAIEVDGVGRTFGEGRHLLTALSDVSFRCDFGETVALLGSNGAGKTTLIKILATLLLPSGGHARVAGHDVTREPERARAATSVVFGGDRGLYARLTGRDNLRFFGMLAGLRRRDIRGRADSVLEQVNLTAAADRRVETYSKGMRQRLHLAIGLMVRPRVLLLDEPTVGLDPLEAQRLREGITALRDEGVGILLTSHYLLDVERLADRVLLLSGGRIVEDLTPAELVTKSGHAATVTVRGHGRLPAVDDLRLPASVVGTELRGDGASWELDLRLRAWSAELFGQLGVVFSESSVDDVLVRETRLEEAFTALAARLQA